MAPIMIDSDTLDALATLLIEKGYPDIPDENFPELNSALVEIYSHLPAE